MTRENPSRILARIKAEIEDLNKNTLPKGVRVRAVFIGIRWFTARSERLALASRRGPRWSVCALLAFYGSPTLAILAVSTIPFSLLFALFVLYDRRAAGTAFGGSD